MKQSDVRRILNHVLTTFSCPKCENKLHQGEVKIDSNTILGLTFSIECPSCLTMINVNGFLPGEKRTNSVIKKNLDLNNLKIAVEKIKKFKGENVAELFQ